MYRITRLLSVTRRDKLVGSAEPEADYKLILNHLALYIAL